VRTSKFALVGVGNIGRRFLEILVKKQETLRARYGQQLVLVTAVDSRGAALNDSGLELEQIVRMKLAGESVAA